jgi:hypothetical protein
LRENEKAPDQHYWEEAQRFSRQEFRAQQRGHSQGECEQLSDREHPKQWGQPGKRGEKRLAELVVKPFRDAIDHFADPGKAPDHQEQQVDRQQGAAANP